MSAANIDEAPYVDSGIDCQTGEHVIHVDFPDGRTVRLTDADIVELATQRLAAEDRRRAAQA